MDESILGEDVEALKNNEGTAISWKEQNGRKHSAKTPQ